jgi:hypothetical protein
MESRGAKAKKNTTSLLDPPRKVDTIYYKTASRALFVKYFLKIASTPLEKLLHKRSWSQSPFRVGALTNLS